MKRLSLILFLTAISLAGIAQEKSGFGFFTDRDVYASGEAVLAKMYLPSGNLSGIVHLDLVNQSGKRITEASLEIKDHQADGYFQLPDSLSSGTYLLRAYLRNTADECRMIREIFIANRFDGVTKIKGTSKAENIKQLQMQLSNEIKITGLQDEARPNSEIQVQLEFDDLLSGKLDENLLISVAHLVPQFESSTFQLGSANARAGLTESRGIIYTGTVTDKKTSTPASQATVYLTIPDSIPEFQYYITGNDGRFYFLIDNYYGDIQAIIQCYPKDPAQRLKIVQDEPYAVVGIMPEFSSNPFSEEFKNEITQCTDAVTFQKIFKQEMFSKIIIPKKKSNSYAYYGIPSNRVDPQLFIDLPNFSEISKELLPGVKFRTHNNEPSMQVINSQSRYFFNEQPLILLDGIPVRDLNVIKDMGTTDIDRVDICQSERFYGDLRFPGVVAIYTTKSDYSKLTENDQLIKLKTEAKQIPIQLTEPKTSEPSVPDLRQTLYWNASAKPQKNITIKFGTSNVQGHFKLTVRGKTTDGTLIFAEKQFEVK
jgi:hypothetical protein